MPYDLGKKSVLSYEVPATVTQGFFKLKDEYEERKKREEKRHASENRNNYLKYILIPAVVAGGGYMIGKSLMKASEDIGVTPYQMGFLSKCAEAGVPEDDAIVMMKRAISGAGVGKALAGLGGAALLTGGGIYLGTKNLTAKADVAKSFSSNLGRNVLLGGLGVGGAISIPILVSALKDRARRNREKKRHNEEASKGLVNNPVKGE